MATRGAGIVIYSSVDKIASFAIKNEHLIFLYVFINFKAPLVAFGSCQKRLIFPTHFAPNRMGNEMLALHGSNDYKALGPGCYDNHTV